jgi:hypothetical protein
MKARHCAARRVEKSAYNQISCCITIESLGEDRGVPRRKKTRIACSALVIGISWPAIDAGAESLALTYALDVRKDAVEHVALPTRQCSGSDWLNAIAPCARDGAAALSSAEKNASVTAISERRVTVGAAGYAAPAAIPHEALQAGDDALDSRRRTSDVSLRLGSKNRLVSAEERRDMPRFVDAPSESYVHSNAHKAIGLELLVPFQ